MLIVSVLIAMAGSSLSAPHTADPLESAEEGLLQCWRPDLSNKTCRVIAAYRKTGPGTYDNTAVVAISSRGPTTVETHTPVVVRGDAVCGPVRTQDIRTGVLRQGARVVASADAKPVLDQIAQVMASLDGQETCTRYEPSGPDFTAKISVAGRYRPELDSKFKWISPADGYIVTP